MSLKETIHRVLDKSFSLNLLPFQPKLIKISGLSIKIGLNNRDAVFLDVWIEGASNGELINALIDRNGVVHIKNCSAYAASNELCDQALCKIEKAIDFCLMECCQSSVKLAIKLPFDDPFSSCPWCSKPISAIKCVNSKKDRFSKIAELQDAKN